MSAAHGSAAGDRRPARPRAGEPPVRGARGRGATTLRGSLVARGLSLLTALLLRMPDRTLHRVAEVAGGGLYLIWPERRALVRSNLARVCGWLAAEGAGGPRVARAARDGRALDRLVRSAFGHYVRSYLEVALMPGMTPAYVAERLRVETPEIAEEAFGSDRAGGVVFVALHLGALELPALYAVARARRPVTAPMETLENAAVQKYLERSRSASGVRIVPARGSGPVLVEALARGEIVGLVADRAIVSGGRPVTLFGAPARLPTGPALLALGSGARVYVVAVRRMGYGDYAGRVLRLDAPGDAARRGRVAAFMARQARLFESLVADAPDQWWTAFFPIWDDEAAREAPAGIQQLVDQPGVTEPRVSRPAASAPTEPTATTAPPSAAPPNTTGRRDDGREVVDAATRAGRTAPLAARPPLGPTENAEAAAR